MTTGPQSPKRDSHEQRALEALAVSAKSADATTFALRYGLARRPGRGIVAGVCAALVDAYGLPVRLMRVFMTVLGLLGPGLFIYLTLFLLLPRVPVNARGDEAQERFDVPARSLARGRIQPGDVVVALGILPSLALAVAVGWAYTMGLQIGLAFLLPLALILAVILGVGAWRATRARTTYLFAVLAKEAGIVGEKELWRTVNELRRDAPRAWARAEESTDDDGVPKIAPAPRVASSHAWLRLMLFFLAALVLVTLASFFPRVMPWVDPGDVLAGLTRTGIALGAVACAVGVSLFLWGREGKRCPQFVAAGFICVLCFGSAVTWIRLTDPRGVAPMTLTVSDYEPGSYIECNPGGIRQWNRPVVIDLSKLSSPPNSEDAKKRWATRNPGADDSTMDLAMTISCHRAVGDVTVILPSKDWSVDTGMTTALGSYDAAHWKAFEAYNPMKVSIRLNGELRVGNITYTYSESSVPHKGGKA